MGRADLISDEYREMQHVLDKDPAYGVASLHYAPLVAKIIESVGATEPLDYGAGKGRLGVALQEALQRPLTVHHYEPAMPQWSVSPQPCRFVACLDVLEHIEPALLGTVLDDLMRVTAQVGVFSVDTGPAQKVLPDGRNAHLLQQPFEWWLPKLKARFDILSVNPVEGSSWWWSGASANGGSGCLRGSPASGAGNRALLDVVVLQLEGVANGHSDCDCGPHSFTVR